MVPLPQISPPRMPAVLEKPRQIGRFRLNRCLGRGTQGEVWLAHDPQLKREVAIKTVLVGAAQDADFIKGLFDEAVMVSRLKHPNIVTLYDAGQDGGRPYLVFEYVTGKTLSALIGELGRLPAARATGIAVKILRALQCAHEKGIVHRDIKPANVMISEGDATQVMDFGIASLFSGEGTSEEGFLGAPSYMAPEYATKRVFTPRSDVFGAGMVLYAMLTGKPAVTGGSPGELLHNLAHAAFTHPSKIVPEIGERLDAIVMRALAQDPDQRYESAERMAQELESYLQPGGAGPASEGASGTLEFLLRRMRRNSDFPALSTTIGAVSKAVASELEGVSALASNILKDFAFTHKLLKLVNTAHFGQFGGTISTISRAIMVMGFDKIRSIAVTLLLFEHLQNNAQADDLKDEVLTAYFSALIARDLVSKAGVRDAEEAFICAMFSRLGKLLVTFYLYDEHLAIELQTQRGASEATASAQVLGISYDELGIGVARSWNFPEKLVASMHPLGDGEIRKPGGEIERLRVLSELSTCLTRVIRDVPPDKRAASVKGLVERFGNSLGITEQHLKDAVQNTVREITHDAGILNFRTDKSAFFNQARKWSADANSRPDPGNGVDAALEAARVEEPIAVQLPATGAISGAARQAILSAGFQDISNALVGDFKLNDVLRIILETMYRGLGFTRAILCIRDPKSNSLKGRFGFGQDVDQIIRAGFSIPLAPARDVFHAAISKGADIYIEDVESEGIRDHIPAWYQQQIPARSLALFPVMIAKKPVGLFYGDANIANSLHFDAGDMTQLKTLRNQAVLAIKSQGT